MRSKRLGNIAVSQRRRDSCVSIFRNFLVLVVIGGIVAVPLRYYKRQSVATQFEGPLLTKQEPRVKCPSHLPLPASPPAPINIWASLSLIETSKIRSWLEANVTLNLTRVPRLNDNSIFLIESYYPTKAGALSYLDSPSNVTVPDRFARVIIHHGGRLDPIVKNYLVGPLPLNEHTNLIELNDIYHRPDIPYNARGFDSDMSFLPRFLGEIMSPISEATKELFGMSVRGLENDTHIASISAPWSFDGSFRRGWVFWRERVPGLWLHTIGLWIYVDISGTDPSSWKQLKIVHNHTLYLSSEEFMEAFRNGTIARPTLLASGPQSSNWSSRARVGPQRDLDHLPGPRSVSFAGVRFRIDRNSQYISWMGWGFYLAFHRDMGLSLFDIRLRNERIAYEISPQEALAHYAGGDPAQMSIAFLDRYFGMGTAVRDMLPGYDCPYESVFLPATTQGGIRKRGTCIFEHDTARPLTRHTGYGDGEFGAVRGYVLVVRSISTVGNYDYYGTIEVRVSASGYLYGGFWEPGQIPYGTRIHNISLGSLHDHQINFKVDLDIAGTRNSLLRTDIVEEEITRPWFDDDWGATVKQAHVQRQYITNEDDALLRYPSNYQGTYSIVNKDATNAWGSPRGYSIHPGLSPVRNTIVGSKKMQDSANWARYNMAVSQRKDTEPSSSSMWNMNLPGAPTVDFHKLFDGENITQEDLVLWISVGTHHLPVAEDAPNTRTNTASSSFFLSPSNYFDSDISIDSTNAILLSPPTAPGDQFTYDDYGVPPQNCLPSTPEPFKWSPFVRIDRDGLERNTSRLEDLRKDGEGYLGIRVEI